MVLSRSRGPFTPGIARPKPRLEKFEQADGVQMLRSLGAHVYVLGHNRPRGDRPSTMQTPGVPDVHAFLPRPRYPVRAGGQFEPRRLVYWEVKRKGGKMRPEQIDYRQACIDAGIAHVVGDFNALLAWLVQEGYLRADQLPYDRQPAEVTP